MPLANQARRSAGRTARKKARKSKGLTLLPRNPHFGLYRPHNRGLEIVSLVLVDMLVLLAPMHVRAGILRFLNHRREALESIARDHCPTIDRIDETRVLLGEDRAQPQHLDALLEHVVQLVVLGRVYDEALDADAVLADVLAVLLALGINVPAKNESLQNSAHPEARPFIEISPLEDDSRIFASEFKGNRCEMLCCRHRNLKIRLRIWRVNNPSSEPCARQFQSQ